MEQKLNKLFFECTNELNNIGINIVVNKIGRRKIVKYETDLFLK